MKKRIRSTLSEDDVQVFSFSINDKARLATLDWEDDHEFRFDGKMYDVIEQKTENGKLIIRCISDEKETALVEKYEKINNDRDNSRSKTALLIKLIGNSYIASSSFDLPAGYVPPTHRPLFPTNIISTDRSDVLTPPPQLA